jgi:ligand-binding sensor domain-containing protein
MRPLSSPFSRNLLILAAVLLFASGLAAAHAAPAHSDLSHHHFAWVHALTTTRHNEVWQASATATAHFDGNGWHPVGTEDGLTGTPVRVIAERSHRADSPTAEIWFGHFGGGISILANGAFRHLTSADGLLSDRVSAFAFPNQQEIWVGHAAFGTLAQGGGVSWFDGNSWQQFPQVAGIASPSVGAMAVGPHGEVWIGLSDYATHAGVLAGGVALYDGAEWQPFTRQNSPLQGSVQVLATAADGTLWVGSTEGLFRFSADGWTAYTSADGLPDNRVTGLALAANGEVWVSTENGIGQFDGHTWQRHAPQLTAENTHWSAIAISPDNTVWAANNSEIVVLQQPTGGTYQIFLPIVIDN